MKKDFEKWLSSFRDSIATWNYYVDFDKVYHNVDTVKIELNILNSLIGSANIEDDFRNIFKKYPEILKAIPILLAKREKEIIIKDVREEYSYNFNKMNYSVDEYVKFMDKTGLFDLLSHHIINNLVDYVMGVEVGMDTNGRKNRTGHIMEDLVEAYLIKAKLIKNKTYFTQMSKTEIERKFKYDLSKISNSGKTEKVFDFVVNKNGIIYAIECNFYGSNGSKLNETARSYKNLAIESQGIKDFVFIWVTDGIGWNNAKHNLEETFDVLDNIYCLKDLDNGDLDKLFN